MLADVGSVLTNMQERLIKPIFTKHPEHRPTSSNIFQQCWTMLDSFKRRFSLYMQVFIRLTLKLMQPFFRSHATITLLENTLTA
jgi:hypothetical protein